LPSKLVKRVEKTVREFKYWPTKTDFVREAVLEKLEKYENRLESEKTALKTLLQKYEED
jgi:Arc/MetJ-type ribon-helix-helix transcriptional regulator